jgi:hypothetical protein
MERFRVPILHALYELADECSAHQLCELARCYAEMGDEPFRDRLYQIVEQRPFPESPWLGDEEIVALDGEQGFLFAARVRGAELAGREWEWHDGGLVDLAVEQFGEENINNQLAASSDAALRRFWQGWRQGKEKNDGGQPGSHRERMKAISVEEIIRAAEGDLRYSYFRGWGMHAREADLQTVLQRLWIEQEPGVIADLLMVFSARALPEFNARLLEFCRHGDEQIRRRAFWALKQNAHPMVREFALTELRHGLRAGLVAALFINNYQQGDEELILDAMELPDDAWERHGLLMSVIKILEESSEADSSRLGVIGYALTPCQNCRFRAARLLHNQGVAPEWLKFECRLDCEEDCRKLVGAQD